MSSDGLETLARAAEAVLLSSSPTPLTTHLSQIPSLSEANEHTCCGPSCSPSETVTPSPTSSPMPVLDLPPLLFPEVPGPTPVVPPFSTFTTLAGSGCTCGLTCQCPDCATHRPRPGADSGHARDCMNCVDQTLHAIDRSSSWVSHMKSPVLEKFFADAKRVPPPPTVRGKPVELPKLCCGGSCNCGGACGCGGDCDGCCQDTEKNETHEDPRSESISATVESPIKSCCDTSK